MTSERKLRWEGCYNVRDLGGLPLTGGGQTRRGSIVRADVLGRLTEKGKQQLLDYGVRTIVDLRAPDEIAEEPSAVFKPRKSAPDYINPHQDRATPEVLALFKAAQTRAELYKLILDHHPANQARILRAIANAQPGAVVFHCHSGKDRTGINAALLLDLAGAEPEAIAADFAATQANLWPVYEQWLAETGGKEKVSRWFVPLTDPGTMREVLDHLHGRHGGAEAYLTRAGLTAGEKARLREKLVVGSEVKK